MDPFAGAATSIRGIAALTLTDSITNTRTNAVLSCRIDDDTEKRGYHLPGMPISYALLRRWEVTFAVGTDVQIGDVLHHSSKGDFACVMVADGNPSTYNTKVFAYVVQLGTAVVCSTKRQPAALTLNATAAYTTYLSALNLRPLGNPSILFETYTPHDETDALGVAVQQPMVCYADWPAGNTDLNPVLPNDILVLPDSTQYVVMGAQSFANWYIAITIEAAVS